MSSASPAASVIHVPLGNGIPEAKSGLLLAAGRLEMLRLAIPAGKVIPPHKATSEIAVQCVEGRIAFTHASGTSELRAGDLITLPPGEVHSLEGLEDSTVLVTRLRETAGTVS
jgi:quercetin dioxygenase-like cupin family protein